jgi:NADH-quinone oxidoreductase subunit L
MVFLTFFGEAKTNVSHPVGNSMGIPLIILAVLSLVGGFIELPHTFGHLTLFSDFLRPVLPDTSLREGVDSSEGIFQLIAAIIGLSGIFIAYVFYFRKPELSDRVKSSAQTLHQFWYSGWGLDWLYDTLFVKPFVFISSLNRRDVIDRIYDGLVGVAVFFNRIFSHTQSGILRWYLAGIVIGTIVILTIGLML